MFGNWFVIMITVIAIVNFFLLIGMVFLEKRKPQNIIAWMTVMTFLPIFGFLLYIVFGSGLSVRTRRMIKKKAISERDIIKNIKGIQTLEQARLDGILINDRELATFCYSFGAYPLPANKVTIFNFGKDKIDSLKKDLLNAKNSIHIEYYIFANDQVGMEIMDILCKKAREGIDVKLIYDSIGSRHAPRKFFNRLVSAGGQVGEFFPPFMHIRLLNLKLNYRNHRKIVVIDGKIGYTGGINIRDDHLGKDKKLKPWRDTHIKIDFTALAIANHDNRATWLNHPYRLIRCCINTSCINCKVNTISTGKFRNTFYRIFLAAVDYSGSPQCKRFLETLFYHVHNIYFSDTLSFQR